MFGCHYISVTRQKINNDYFVDKMIILLKIEFNLPHYYTKYFFINQTATHGQN